MSDITQSGERALWQRMRQLTDARIGLTRAGAGLSTGDMLDVRRAHALARDAVHSPLDTAALADRLALIADVGPIVASAAPDRQTYLMRPDLGRRLSPEGVAALRPHAGEWDLAVVIADGLSARAVADHAAPVLAETLPALRATGWRIAPIVIAGQSRVALGDAVAMALSARAVVVLIGERPGLSAHDSMSAYLTWAPHAATVDAERNCLSNIRPAGTPYAEAARQMVALLNAMRALGLSGVALKADETPSLPTPGAP